jgi:hypothetical protein
VQCALRAELAQDVVGDAVGELPAMAAVGEQAAERADDRIDGLPAERGQPIDQGDLAAASAAETPAMPAPSTQISADTCRGVACSARRTIRVAVEIVAWSALIVGGPVTSPAKDTDRVAIGEPGMDGQEKRSCGGFNGSFCHSGTRALARSCPD